uniref:AlNc14C341G10797 protein n=1 Tax=Albugo laibachii Nc14 TaxID=890382 RepID=F0WX40_9STRA|nr:AlNc14C341G10797 [Albugo laibachii Nc14]|eukprot:CCA26029.1 AlNc14C341G10797 [Albugo laibachii Nc14]
MDVDCGNNVFFVEVYEDKFRGCGSTTDSSMAVLAKSEHESDLVIQCGTLADFHRRLGHSCYDRIIKTARDPASGIRLTITMREHCFQGKQTKNVQTNKDTAKTRQLILLKK